MHLEIALGMAAGGADFRSLCAHDDMPAVAAFPYLDFALLEHLGCLYIVEQGAIAFFVMLFNRSDIAELLCQFRKALLLSCFSETFIHISPLKIFAFGGMEQVFSRIARQ